MKQALSFAIAGVLAAISTSASADVQFGGTRAQGMGGAGLALPVDAANNFRLNPALLAYAPKGLSVSYPSVQLKLDGLSVGDLNDYFGNIKDGGLDSDKLIKFANKFGSRRHDLGLNGSLGLLGGGFALTGMGEAVVSTLPNATLQSSVGSGTPANGSQLDGYGLGYYGYGLSYGNTVPVPEGGLSIGANAHVVKAYYAHQIVSYTAGGVTSGPASGDVGGHSTVSDSGFGADLGFLYHTKDMPNVHYGFVAENLIKPNIKFDRQLANSTTVLKDDIDPFQTNFRAGVGATIGKNILLAADYLDLGNRTGNSQIALGAEYHFGSTLALRAGYNSKNSFSVGFSAFGLNVAFANNIPITIGAGFRF